MRARQMTDVAIHLEFLRARSLGSRPNGLLDSPTVATCRTLANWAAFV
jgi:hypothetical protein